MAEDTRNFREQDANKLSAQWHVAAKQFFDRQRKGVLLVHRCDVIEAVEIRHRLKVGFVLDQLFRASVKQPDVRIGSFDHLAIHFEHKAQYPVCRGMLGPEIDREVLDFYFAHEPSSSAFSSPGRTYWVPSHGL